MNRRRFLVISFNYWIPTFFVLLCYEIADGRFWGEMDVIPVVNAWTIEGGNISFLNGKFVDWRVLVFCLVELVGLGSN